MVAVTARTAAGLQVEAQASLDSRKHERWTDGKPGQARTPAAIQVASARTLEPELGSCQARRQGGCPCRTASGACKTCGKKEGRNGRRRVRGAAAEARMVRNTWQLEGSDLLGKTCRHGRASTERWARTCRPEVLSARLGNAPGRLACLHRTQPR